MDRLEIVMDAINALVPNAQYNIYGDFSGLQWLDSRTAPKETDVKKKYDEIIAEEPLNLLRDVRNRKLAKSDWVVIKEREEGGSVSNFADWKKYRQELRDITKTYKSLDEVKWPIAPSE
jgi:hypothetical protein